MMIDPSAGPPNTSPTLAGEYTGTLYWFWSNREGSGRVDYVGKIMFGDYHCYVSQQTLQAAAAAISHSAAHVLQQQLACYLQQPACPMAPATYACCCNRLCIP